MQSPYPDVILNSTLQWYPMVPQRLTSHGRRRLPEEFAWLPLNTDIQVQVQVLKVISP